MGQQRTLGVAIVGMGWMGHVHARSYRAAVHRYPELDTQVRLIVCADANEDLAAAGARDHGFTKSTTDWQQAVDDPEVDIVSVTAPNFLHADICAAAAAADKHIWCEKPVGRDATEAARAAQVADQANIATMSGFNYHWVPMVQYTRQLLADGELGEVEMFRGRFYSMFANDPLGLYSWRFKRELAGNGAVGDLLSHVADMALELVGPISEVCGQQHVFIEERPMPKPGKVSHYARGEPGDPTAKVENEDFAGALVKFASGAFGVIEGWRTACGPKSDMGFELYCTKGSVKWTLEEMNCLQIFLKDKGPLDGYARVLAGERHPDHAHFNPGDGNPIGYEDTKTIEAARLLDMVVKGQTEPSGLRRASNVADIGAAVFALLFKPSMGTSNSNESRWLRLRPLDVCAWEWLAAGLLVLSAPLIALRPANMVFMN